MTADLFKLMAEASFVAWRDRMVSTGQAPEVAGSTYDDLTPSEQEFAMLHVNAVVAALDAAGWAIVPKALTDEQCYDSRYSQGPMKGLKGYPYPEYTQVWSVGVEHARHRHREIIERFALKPEPPSK